VGLLEETQSSTYVERDVSPLQFELDLQGMPVAAIEDGDIVQAPPFIQKMQNVFGDKAGLDEMIVTGNDSWLET
jgi:hypothetical protein